MHYRVVCGRYLMCVCILGGCGRLSFDPSADASAFSADDASGMAWGTPTPLPELDAAGADEDPSMTADRLLIVWSSDRPAVGAHDLWMASRTSPVAPFDPPVQITNLATAGYEGSPEVSPDGLTLFFSSDITGDDEIYVSTRATRGDPWGPASLRADLSSAEPDFELAVSPDGLTAVVNRNSNFYEYTRPDTSSPFAGARLIPELHISNDTASPTIDNGARTIYFHLGNPRNIYVARRSGTTFSTPESVTEINNDMTRSADPFMSADDTLLLFNCEASLCVTERP